MKKLNYSYFHPSHYFYHILTFFVIIGFLLTFVFVEINSFDFMDFFLKFIVIEFLLFTMAALVEFFNKSDYISPLEMYDVKCFVENFLKRVRKNSNVEKDFLKYSISAKKKFEKEFSKKQFYFVSSIRRDGNNFYVSLINEKRLLRYFLFKFLVRGALHHLTICEVGGKFKIIKWD